ncbi:hypothetical protein A3K93_00725 [Acinetobacter sp. NCu2D-2]|uniref:hypothetical protein n=1 Tax=Acinetobacter sp. NCu2D-2 TaxID=1608473 RepID=UPI0007CDFB45|nr:hypothetical protein [Acinetobacter sp. NCu2D-2]ANF80856.1 hypothetical protein A3K93_00725 [Acinetobacter sp. NCu2D-2]
MKKIVWIIIGIALVWVAKLSFDVYGLNQQQVALTQTLAQVQAQNDNLNDQVASLKRRVMGGETLNSSDANASTSGRNLIDDAALVRQQLDLIEFALQQQQYATAIDKLNQMERSLVDYEFSAAMRESLQVVIAKDRIMLKQYAATQIDQNNKLKELLRKVDQQISQELAKPYQSNTQEQSSFWKRLIHIEPANKSSEVLMQRAVVLKEAQLRLVMAQNTLQQGQQIPFAKAVDSVIEVLRPLPDAQSKRWIEQLNTIKSSPVLPLPNLSTRTLIGG